MGWEKSATCPHIFLFLNIYLFMICLFGCARPYLRHAWSFSCIMWDIVTWPGIKLRPPVLGTQSPSHCITREVPLTFFLFQKKCQSPMWKEMIRPVRTMWLYKIESFLKQTPERVELTTSGFVSNGWVTGSHSCNIPRESWPRGGV